MKNKMLKIRSIISIIILCFCILSVPVYAYSGYVGWVSSVGDINYDGYINSQDYAMLKTFIYCQAEPTREQKIAADVNLDWAIDGLDAIDLDNFVAEYGEYEW